MLKKRRRQRRRIALVDECATVEPVHRRAFTRADLCATQTAEVQAASVDQTPLGTDVLALFVGACGEKIIKAVPIARIVPLVLTILAPQQIARAQGRKTGVQ